MEQYDAKIYLCDDCIHSYPECPGEDIRFGKGKGNDNVIACNGFNPGRNISEICLEISKLIKHSNVSAETSFKIDELLEEIVVVRNKESRLLGGN